MLYYPYQMKQLAKHSTALQCEELAYMQGKPRKKKLLKAGNI